MLLLSDYVALGLCVLVGVLLVLGVLSRHRWLNAISYITAVAIYAVHVLDAYYDIVWVTLIPHPAVIMPMLAAVWIPLAAILIGLARYIKRPRDRRALYIIAGLVSLYSVYAVGRQLVFPPVNHNSQWEMDTLIQSTGTTCVAAASATYLHTLGYDIDETTAAARGLISASVGGTDAQAWRILRLTLPAQYRIRIARADKAQLAEGGWFVTSVRWAFAVGHEVAVRLEPGGAYVRVRDPLSGEYLKPWDEFNADWLRVVTWAELVTPDPAACRVELPQDYAAGGDYPLVVFLHGFGGSSERVFRFWDGTDGLSAVLALPRGTFDVPEGYGEGFSWVYWDGANERQAENSWQASIGYVGETVDEMVARYQPGAVYLMGFSQGCALAYSAGITHHAAIDGIICCGGLLPAEELGAETIAAAAGDLRVFIVNGDEDSFANAQAAYDWLSEYGYDVELFTFSGGHTIPPEAHAAAAAWIKAAGKSD
ncbi:hypothetical protein JW859_10760 [bacterium]|nr:hypothetical protein [bacterium]